MMEAEYKKATAAGPATLPGLGTVPLYLFNTTLKADDTSWNWNVGVLLTPAEKTKIGLSYRSTTSYTLSGDLTTSGPNPVLAGALSSNAEAEIKLPDTFIFSVTQGIGDNWELLGDISWTGWSSVPYVDIVATSGLNNGRTVQTLDTKFNDAWRFALGANYKLNEQVKLRTGIAYDNTPVPDAQHRLTSLPDNDRTWLSVGAQYKPTKESALDVGFAYIFVKDAPINNLDSPPAVWSRVLTATVRGFSAVSTRWASDLRALSNSSSPGESGAFFRVFLLKKALTATVAIL